MERNLPIQLVETRGKQDIFLKEGFGNEQQIGKITSSAKLKAQWGES